MEAREDEGYATLKELARGDIPEEFFTVVGVLIVGNTAYVWSLTNDHPPFEANEDVCVRDGGRWALTSGTGGFGANVPHEVLEEAARHGWR